MPSHKVATPLNHAADAAALFRDAQIGEGYDYDLPDGITEEEGKRILTAAAASVLGKQLRILAWTDEDTGTRYLRAYIKKVPVTARPISETTVASPYEDWSYYDQLLKQAEPGVPYEATFENVAVASVLRQLHSAARRVHGKRLNVALSRHSNDRFKVRYTLTDKPAAKLLRNIKPPV